jgi:hypothetical protein
VVTPLHALKIESSLSLRMKTCSKAYRCPGSIETVIATFFIFRLRTRAIRGQLFYRVGFSADHQAESLDVLEPGGGVPESGEELSALLGLGEDVLDLLA